MRTSMFLTGLFIIAFGLFLGYSLGYPIWITGAIGLFNIFLGAITPKSRKVDLQPEPSGAVKLLVDKVMFRYDRARFNNSELVFLDTRLVIKKLASWKVVLVVALVFAGIGGLVGGLTGLSMQEFLDQRKRDKILHKNQFTTVSPGDMEISYESMSQIQLTGTNLSMFVRGRLLVFSMASEYPPMIARRVREVIPNQSWARPGSAPPVW
jgi:hypothetical protein